MKRLLVMMAVMLASSQAFSLESFDDSVNSLLEIFTIEISESSSGSEDDSSDEENERPNVLIVNTEEIYEATGVTEQELLIQIMQDQE